MIRRDMPYEQSTRRDLRNAGFILALCLLTLQARAQDTYRVCEMTYNGGDYAEASTCFSTVATDQSNSKEVRNTALEYWSRSAFALKEMDQAREAIEALMIEQLQDAAELKVTDPEDEQRTLPTLAMVFVRIGTFGHNEVHLRAHVVNVTSGNIFLDGSVEGTLDNFYELLGGLSERVAASIMRHFPQEEIAISVESHIRAL